MKPMPPPVLHALLEKMDDPIDSAAKGSVIRRLGQNGVVDPLFIQAIMDALAGSNRELLGAAAAVAATLGPPAKVVAPVLRRALEEGRIPQQDRFTAEVA